MAEEAETPAPKPASKTRLVTLADLDKRTKAAQVAEGTRSAIIADLGGEDRLSTLELAMCEHAAVDAAIIRDMTVRWLRGDPVSLTEMVSVRNTFNRTAAALGMGRRQKDVTTIDAYLGQKAQPGDDSPEGSGK